MHRRTRQVAVALAIAGALLVGGCAEDKSTANSGGGDNTDTPAAGGGGGGGGDGAKLYSSTCAACHGKDALGMPNLGKDLTTSEFAKGLSDADLVAFMKKGRDTSDPANTTGVAMPPKGGNPALSDSDLESIVTYLRTLEK